MSVGGPRGDRPAWVFAATGSGAAALSGDLAPLGYRVRRLPVDQDPWDEDRLVPPTPPQVVFLVAGDGTPLAALRDRLNAAAQGPPTPRLLVIGTEAMRSGWEQLLDPGEELVVAPWTAAELGARIELARRRLGHRGGEETYRAGGIELDPRNHQVKVDGHPIELAFKEYLLLRFLVTHPNRVHSRARLLNEVWGYDFFGGTRTVDVHVRRIRAKLGPEHSDRLQTVRTVGYRFVSLP